MRKTVFSHRHSERSEESGRFEILRCAQDDGTGQKQPTDNSLGEREEKALGGTASTAPTEDYRCAPGFEVAQMSANRVRSSVGLALHLRDRQMHPIHYFRLRQA
jgi:hypothetical protein